MRIERFEDLHAWKIARELSNLVYDVTDTGNFSHDFELRNQIRGAAGSVMHNLAEGFDAGADGEFVLFLRYARRSASEVQSQLYLALDRKYISEEMFQKIYTKALDAKKTINALMAYLRKSKARTKKTK